jgi:hypothetical protein
MKCPVCNSGNNNTFDLHRIFQCFRNDHCFEIFNDHSYSIEQKGYRFISIAPNPPRPINMPTIIYIKDEAADWWLDQIYKTDVNYDIQEGMKLFERIIKLQGFL